MYVLPAAIVWAGIYAAGIHPTIAGVIVGLATPVRIWLGPEGFVATVGEELQRLEHKGLELSTHELASALRHVDAARREAMSPAESLIEMLHPWVAFGIMPVFALANAGVEIAGGAEHPSSPSVVAAVIVGLVLGKPLGVLLASWLALRGRFGVLPAGIGHRHLLVLGVVAGVGFTMALFIANLAFLDPHLLGAAKLGVLAASAAAACLGLSLGLWLLEPSTAGTSARTADEAESSTDV